MLVSMWKGWFNVYQIKIASVNLNNYLIYKEFKLLVEGYEIHLTQLFV